MWRQGNSAQLSHSVTALLVLYRVHRLQCLLNHSSTPGQPCDLQGPDAAQRFLRECRDLGFDALEFGCAPFLEEACARMIADIKQVRR